MPGFYFIAITSLILAASPVWAQEDYDEQASACVVEPIFHCAQKLKEGSAVGHFGYNLHCPSEAEPARGVFIDIGDDNLFSPARIDRGQPKVFLSGEHIDEFSVDFSAAEIKADSLYQWSVLDQTVTVDFSKTKDKFLDCSILP